MRLGPCLGSRQRSIALTSAAVAVMGFASLPAHAAAKSKPKPKPKPKASAARDWEAQGSAPASASFAERAVTTGKGKKRKRVNVIQSLVVQAPVNCADSPTPAIPIDVQVIPATITLTAHGTFTSGKLKHGAGTTVSGTLRGKRVSITYRHVSRVANQYDGGTEVCDTGKVHLTGAPGHRFAIKDQAWQGQTATSEPLTFNVVAGGRALQAPAHPPANGAPQASIAVGAFTQSCGAGSCSPSSTDICAYETPVTLYVGPDGSFGNTLWQAEDQGLVSGQFTSAKAATGNFANGGEGCQQTTWSASAG
jgi:hypothetical protein